MTWMIVFAFLSILCINAKPSLAQSSTGEEPALQQSERNESAENQVCNLNSGQIQNLAILARRAGRRSSSTAFERLRCHCNIFPAGIFSSLDLRVAAGAGCASCSTSQRIATSCSAQAPPI